MEEVGLTPLKDSAKREALELEKTVLYPQGWKLWLLTAGLWIGLFLSSLESTIVSTSLVSIANALNGFILRDWIVTAYLLSYTSFLTIYAKFGDIFGRKTMLLLALTLLTVFSTLCSVSNNIVELIIFRAFQGIGASGIYSTIMAITPSIVPPTNYGKYTAIVFIVSVLGPVMGGVINSRSSCIPGGMVSFILVAVYLPMSEASFKLSPRQRLRRKFERSTLARIDIVGIFLLLASSVLLIFALEEGGTRYFWNSAAIVSSLVIAIVLGILFVIWETFLGDIAKDRLPATTTSFFTSFAFISMMVNIPQKMQAVSHFSPVEVGVASLPLLLTAPLATALSGFLVENLAVPPFYLITIASVLQVVGVGLTCSLPADAIAVPTAQYGYEIIIGFGFGLGLTNLLIFARAVVPERNLAVMIGALTQLRVLGGAIPLGVCATILNNYAAPRAEQVASPQQAQAISNSLLAINDLTPAQQTAIRSAFAEGYHKQNIFMAVLKGIGLISSCFLWEKTPRKGSKPDKNTTVSCNQMLSF
ncbi:Major facilitator superfamily domain containing protein [Elaphomyces granulatus]